MKYPFDIVSYVRNKTFSIEARFSQETEESPLKVFGRFSRYVMTVISEGKSSYMNIHIEDLASMKRLSEIAFNEYTRSANKSEQAPARLAFSKTFRFGPYAGKCPAQVYLESGENGKQIMNSLYMELKKNADRYPANRELMEAIKDAGSMTEEEMRSGLEKNSNMAPMKLLDIGYRPLTRKTRADGKSFCYEGSISFDFSKNYPVTVRVANYYAPVEKKPNGMLNVKIAEKDKSTEVVNEFSMLASEWMNAIDMMTLARDAYYHNNFANAARLAEEADRANRNSQSQAAAQMNQQMVVTSQPPVRPVSELPNIA